LTLLVHVSPPSMDAANRGQYPKSGLSRRSYQSTPTTPWGLAATAGFTLSCGRSLLEVDPSSPTSRAGDQVRPESDECEIITRVAPLAASNQTA
jgi:hypothetical protein